jgi:hypothetical protein
VGQRAIAVVAAAADVGDDADVRLRVIVVLVVPAIPPPLTAVESVDCPHRASSSDWWPLATRRLARLTAIPRSPAIGPVVQRRCTASRRRRRRNPRRQPLTAWNRRCPARRRPLWARRRQGRSPERREGQRGGISC